MNTNTVLEQRERELIEFNGRQSSKDNGTTIRDDTRPPTTKAAVAAAAFVSERAKEGQIKENAPNNFHIKKTG